MLSSRPHSRSGCFRLAAVATLVAFTSACSSWKVVPLKEIETEREVKPSTVIRVHLEGSAAPITLEVQSLSYPNVTGRVLEEQEVGPRNEPRAEPRIVSINLAHATSVEVRTVSGWRTLLLVTGIVVGAAVVLAVIVALTKTSCPFVYVDGGGGMQFVGEAYSGATSRSIQREDLMPLPPLGASPQVVLANEAKEDQFTDLLEVVVVDRSPGKRALATHDARVVLAGAPVPPSRATDLDGRDVLDDVRQLDGRIWQTDLDAASRRAEPPSGEGVVLTFPAPPAGHPVALELEAGNTLWLDVVFGRFFALLGDRLDRYLDRTDRPESRDEILAWREREGVDLRVEVERGGRWQRVAVVPTVGPASLRNFAVPLPPVEGPELRVRLTAGVGFWLADRIALTPIDEASPRTSRFAPTRAAQGDGSDVRALLASADGHYQVLADRGERVDLSFELPLPGPGLERDAFLHTSGYYRVHRPPQAELSTGTLYRLRDEPGSLSRFSLDLYRQYQAASAGPVAAAP